MDEIESWPGRLKKKKDENELSKISFKIVKNGNM